MNYYIYSSPIGNLLLTIEDGFLIGLELVEETFRCQQSRDDTINLTIIALNHYFNRKPFLLPPIKLKVSPFSAVVLSVLAEVESGKMISYKALATEVARRMNKNVISSQAIGNALNKNPIMIFYPCHRVIKSDGTLGGFAYGGASKLALLTLEGAILENRLKPVKLL